MTKPLPIDLDLPAALSTLPNISAFCLKYDLPRRTVMRVKTGVEPTPTNYRLIAEALKASGHPAKRKAVTA